MKKTIWLFLIVSLAIFAIAPLKFAAVIQSREFRKTVEFVPGGDLRFNTDKGSVRMTSWDQSRVEIYARIEPPEHVDADYGQRAVDAARIEVSGDARSLTIRSNFDDVPYKDGEWHSRSLPHIHYEIRAPRNLNLDLGADRCKVEAQGFAGRIRIDTDRTPVTANELSGEIQIKMDRGKATITRFQGRLDLDTDRTDSRLQAVRIEGDSRLNIGRGECELKVPDSQGLALNARLGRRERFYNDFGLTVNSLSDRNNIEGVINGGGPRLTIEGDRGVIRLKRY
ncbi:MAG: hypothetical protein ACREA2_20305 [Blastocatellia bacterium]